MADKVVRLVDVANVEHSVEGESVVLKLTGRSDGREVRVELELDMWECRRAVNAIRTGVKTQADAWNGTLAEVGVIP